MVGFLLRLHLQIIFFFLLLNSIPAIFIVTLGGKILGVTIIALISSVLQSQIVCEKVSLIFTNSILLIGIFLVGYLLPGYVVVDLVGTIVILGLIMLIHMGLGKYIKDR